jgi:hypothetical protein
MIIVAKEGTEFEAIHKQLGFHFCSDRALTRDRICSIKRLLSLCLFVRMYMLNHSWTDFREIWF